MPKAIRSQRIKTCQILIILAGMKKILYTFVLLLIIGLIGFFSAAGKIVDSQMNILVLRDHQEQPEAILNFHDSLIIADWHSDNLLWDRNPLQRLDHGHVDVPRLIEGNVTLQVFDAVIKTPKGLNYDSNTGDTDNITLVAMANRWPLKTWISLYERARHQARILTHAADRSEGKLRIIRSSDDLKQLLMARAVNKEIVGGMLSIEGLHALEGRIDYLDSLYAAGYRMMGLVHFFDNKVGGSSAGQNKGGLTDFGRQVIHRMNDLGIIIDLAHASSATIREVLETTNRPVVVSHTGVRGTHDIQRNLSDDEIRRITAKGGIIGIGFWDGAAGDYRPESIARAIRHVTNLVGVDHVSLGSDWDGATTIYFDAAHIVVLTEALLEAGFTRSEIRRIMGANQLEFLMRWL